MVGVIRNTNIQTDKGRYKSYISVHVSENTGIITRPPTIRRQTELAPTKKRYSTLSIHSCRLIHQRINDPSYIHLSKHSHPTQQRHNKFPDTAKKSVTRSSCFRLQRTTDGDALALSDLLLPPRGVLCNYQEYLPTYLLGRRPPVFRLLCVLCAHVNWAFTDRPTDSCILRGPP